jgi:hypothetical protein
VPLHSPLDETCATLVMLSLLASVSFDCIGEWMSKLTSDGLVLRLSSDSSEHALRSRIRNRNKIKTAAGETADRQRYAVAKSRKLRMKGTRPRPATTTR